jgi:hypothetical protein
MFLLNGMVLLVIQASPRSLRNNAKPLSATQAKPRALKLNSTVSTEATNGNGKRLRKSPSISSLKKIDQTNLLPVKHESNSAKVALFQLPIPQRKERCGQVYVFGNGDAGQLGTLSR